MVRIDIFIIVVYLTYIATQSDPKVKAGKEGSFRETTSWVKKYLWKSISLSHYLSV